MTATTIRQMLTGALRLVNVVQANEVPSEEDMNITLTACEAMIESWSNDSLMIYTMNPYDFQTVGGQQAYTLGTGGDWNTNRPIAINQAYVHYISSDTLQPVDMPITMANDAQWASIAVKSVSTTFPTVLYDNGNYPLRTIKLWPIPTGVQTITLWLRQSLLNFSNIDEVLSFPPGYERAIRFNTACEIAPEFGKTISEDVLAKAAKAKSELKSINTVTQFQNFDQSLTSANKPFNWITGNFVPFR